MYTYISKTMVVEVYLSTGFAMICHQCRSAAGLESNREERTITITMLVAHLFLSRVCTVPFKLQVLKEISLRAQTTPLA